MRRTKLRLEALDDRALPSAGVPGLIAVGADAGGLPEVKLLNTDGTVRERFLAYDESFRGGVRVAVGDVNGDGRLDVVTAPGTGGGPHVKVFDAATATQISAFFAFDAGFRGGVNLDVGRLDGREVIVVGAGLGGAPTVKVFDGRTHETALTFLAYDAGFRGGVSVAVGDVYGDGRGAIVTGPGPGGGPHVKVFDGATGRERAGFFAYAPGFSGGVAVAAGNVVNLGGRDAIITGAGPGGGPQVNIFDATTGQSVQTQFVYSSNFRGGVSVSVIQGGPGVADQLVTAAGPSGGPQVNVYDQWNRGFPAGYGYGGLGGFGSGYGAFGLGNSFFAFPSYFAGGLAFGSGFGLYDPFIPDYGAYYAPGWFYDYYDAPVFIDNNLYVDPATYQYYSEPAFTVPDTIPYIDESYYYDDGAYYDYGSYDYYDYGGYDSYYDYGGF